MGARETVFRLGLATIARSGAGRWLKPLAQGLGLILMLHHVRPWEPRGFAPNRLLEVTPEFLDAVLTLARHEGFDFVALDEAAERIRAAAAARPFLAVTFDDGYRDNAHHAFPVLKRHGVPWTMFVTTGFATRTASLWWLELEEAIRRLDRIDIAIGEERLSLPAGSDRAKEAAFDNIYWRLRAGPEERLRAIVAELAEDAGVDGRKLVETLCLDWTGIRQLAAESGVTIGAHTLTHPMLAKQDAVFARHEVIESRTIIERIIDKPVRHFAYPVGDPGSAGPREFGFAAEAGYETAVTTRPGHVFAGHADHLLALPRVSLNGNFQTREAAKALLSGIPFLLWNRGRALNVA